MWINTDNINSSGGCTESLSVTPPVGGIGFGKVNWLSLALANP